ncbi:bifunctional DNA primase/polymerase [Bradyrhizobium canariense]|uniref:bifunctional DNA primase/polymerase n=1 Tax=Bradyrhizobium canariense TaxID=255045 RepID=UPI0013747BC6|nr:bifunctional DNA primase/polymerase [Bradyrhizobium canariense]
MLYTGATNVEHALDAARRGLRVYPLAANTEEPAFPEADTAATTDESQVREWWALWPDANIGIATDNLLAIRIDPRCTDEAFRNTLGILFQQHGGRTGSLVLVGELVGSYVMFELPAGTLVQGQSNFLSEHMSVLSSVDDVLIGPGSTINGLAPYRFHNERSLSPAPSWLLELCGVELPESKKMTNVVPLKRSAAAAPTTAAIKTKLDWALEASQHVPVHPCRWYVDPGPDANPDEREKAIRAAKEPLTKWRYNATQDPEKIRKMWSQWPDANIGGVTDQLLVLDVDKKNGGCETYEFLRLVEDFPETMTNNTQGGGQHLFYAMPAGEPLKNSTHTLGPGIDVRTEGGYVMMPGSTIDGRSYTRANDAPIVFAPAWMIERCKDAKPKSIAAGKRVVEEDDIAIDLFTKWILKRAPYAELGKIDDTTFVVCAQGYDFGCSQETVYEIALGWNETHCDGLGDIERLAVVVESAGRNRRRPIGCSHPLAPGFDAVVIDESKTPTPAEIAAAEAGHEGAWENEPNAIFVDHLKPADLPTGVLPELVEQFARDRARRLGVDAGAPAAALVTALGSLVPAGNRLQMRQLDTEWTVKPILWTAIIGPPGSNKSATINAAMGPVQKLQSAWRKSFAADEHKRKLGETRRATAEKAAKAKPENTDQVFEGGEAEAGKPRFRQKIYNDATTEALAVALCENPEGLLYHADELAGWLAGMDAYRAKGGKDRAFWLQAKEGGDFTVNRKLSERICVENCAISVLGGIQPDKIRALKLGMSDDGLLQRFTPIVIHRSGNGADIAPDTATGERLTKAANAIADAANGALFRFSPEADAELHAVEAFKAKEIARPDASPTLRQWLDKMPNEFGRLSLVFHFIEHYGASGAAGDAVPAVVIGRGTAERARRYLTEFVYSHALTFYLKDLGASTMDEHALWIAGFVLARGLPAISSRDIYRVYPALKSPEKRSLIVATMRVLEMHDWVKPAHADRHGVEDRWTVNPAVHDGRFAEIAATERSRRDGVQERIKLGAAA